MMKRIFPNSIRTGVRFFTLLLLISGVAYTVEVPQDMQQVIVYKEEGRFGGWPANHGIWNWGNEILVGFSRGDYKNLGQFHHIDRERPEEHLLARSLDGGETWQIEDPAANGYLIPEGTSLHGIQPPWLKTKEWTDCPGGINFAHPDFAMTIRMTDVDMGPSRFYYSYDRGHTWSDPFRLTVGDLGIAARTDYIINGPQDCFLILTAGKTNRQEGRPFCARTQDGGKTWQFLSWIMPELPGFAIMPATVRISANQLLSALRVHDEGEQRWIDCYLSEDNGQTWNFLSRPAPDTGRGNPADLVLLQDGRIAITYGVRKPPYSMCARISSDQGKTWGPELILRNDGGSHDIGYSQSVQRPDGKLVTVYYFTNDPLKERYIAATIWDPK
jgi:hypothetical protein